MKIGATHHVFVRDEVTDRRLPAICPVCNGIFARIIDGHLCCQSCLSFFYRSFDTLDSHGVCWDTFEIEVSSNDQW